MAAARGANNTEYRGFLQSSDGLIAKVLDSNKHSITFLTSFPLSGEMAERFRDQPEHIVFSERSRIARLGMEMTCETPRPGCLEGGTAHLTLTATPVITGYPGLDMLREFFAPGMPVGRIVFCDPEALLSSDEVLEAIEKAQLKLPESTAISSNGSVVIVPHKVLCEMRGALDRQVLSRILFRQDGRELLNRYQKAREVSSLRIRPGEGIITTCSMYLNEHYVVLQSGFELGKHLAATVLDPIKTRGIRIYLEIVNRTQHPIVNPLISAKIYRSSQAGARAGKAGAPYAYSTMLGMKDRFEALPEGTCHFMDKPAALLEQGPDPVRGATIFLNGPKEPCTASKTVCAMAWHDMAPRSLCPHAYGTALIRQAATKPGGVAVLKYFPNLAEHLDIISMAGKGQLRALYFFEPSCEHGPFLSEHDHNRLAEYHDFGLPVYWMCGLNKRLMVHAVRDGKGYFVAPERLAEFQTSMLFAFYGSTLGLSAEGKARMGKLMDALLAFWGKNIGIVTGGGSGVMEIANTLARERKILSGANFLDITDQSMTTDVDFCQVFQATCRHSRQKWFEVASFPIFNVGGIGSLEELGITLCNMKLSIMEPVPIILFETEGDKGVWRQTAGQIAMMVRDGRAPAWMLKNIVITSDPQAVVDAYRQRLQLF